MLYQNKKTYINNLNSKIKSVKLRIVKLVFKYIGVDSFIKKINLDNYSFKLELSTNDSGLAKQLYFSGWREFYSTKYYINYLEKIKPKYIFELGANIGYFACIAKSVLEDSFVYCAEPVPKNCKILRRNIEINNFSNVKIFNVGIGEEDSKSTIYTFDFDNWATFNEDHAIELKNKGYNCKEEVVDIIKLTSLQESLQTPIDLIRMDIEGYEYEIIKANIEFLNNNEIDIFMEFHTNILEKERVTEILQILISIGYQYSVVIFNNPFCDNDEYFQNTKHKPKRYTIEKLLSEINLLSENEIKLNDGFELFLSKNNKDI